MTKIPYSTAGLVDAVRKRRILWDHTLKSSFKRDKRKTAWNEVAALFLEDYVDGT